ncbi:MAG TPA: hypothetical protein VEF53_18655 [Patescibacteria group bacterium]|nr:hypothetical protein [Patescibacteria group bacterium]
MKQHITLKQLLDAKFSCRQMEELLNAIGVDKTLDDYLAEHQDYWSMGKGEGNTIKVNWPKWEKVRADFYKPIVKLITIGKMIEILHQNANDFKLAVNWGVQSGYILGIKYKKKEMFYIKDEPCDCLWEAVKEVLEGSE